MHLFSATELSKAFPGVQALSDVDLVLEQGQVHALVGENGAGKSTLSRIIAGIEQPDCGRMTLGGEPYQPTSRPAAEALGVRMVMQELNLVGNLTVAENIFIGKLPSRFGFVDYRKLNSDAAELMRKVGLEGVEPDRLVKSLGIGQQQMVEIAAGLSQRCRVLILDEPTASLTDNEVKLLFEQIRKLKADGVGIIYISHRLEEVMEIADWVTVLRDGKVVATHPIQQATMDQIIRWMVGRDLQHGQLRQVGQAGEVALRVVHLHCGQKVKDVSFELRRGEILGFAGLMGSGRTETMRALFGADRPSAGEIYLYDSPKPTKIHSPKDAVRHGIALLTEDRKEQGLLLPLSVRENISLSRLEALSRFGWIDKRAERSVADSYISQLAIRCTTCEQRVRQLSGGNQQKVVIAKWLFRDCDILIFDEPTRGIDVGAKFEIYQMLDRLAQAGKAVIFVSSDLMELMAVCDRIAVMSNGRLVRIFPRGQWTEEKIMAAALSGYVKESSEPIRQ